jgi:PERQ amino acid-rich with GYF domain-containing protein
VNIVAPEGFWEPVIATSTTNAKKPQPPNTTTNNNNSNAAAKKKGKKEGGNNKQANSNNNRAERNEFEEWCTTALHSLQAQVDIPTFLTFLRDVESPYEVGCLNLTC